MHEIFISCSFFFLLFPVAYVYSGQWTASREKFRQSGIGGGGGLTAYVALPSIKRDTLVLFDTARNRSIPVAYYAPDHKPDGAGCNLVIVSHGYNENRPRRCLGYAYIGERLAAMGYFVVSIQHELPTDSLIPVAGIPQVVRKAFLGARSR